jgi:hypothetical protein
MNGPGHLIPLRGDLLRGALGAFLLLGAGGCAEGTSVDAGGGDPAPEGTSAPTARETAGPAELEPVRRGRRLTADQFHRSLALATGFPWTRYEQFASSLGRPDYAEITAEGLEASVTFDKLVHDAARESCARAVIADGGRPVPGSETILRYASVADRDPAVLRENLAYLLLRFHAVDVAGDGADPRLDPYLDLLLEPAPGNDTQMAYRWVAVCVALATHPDFLTY